jgi:hypothetical protein
MKCILNQPHAASKALVVSWLRFALAESVTTPAWLDLANDAFYLVRSAVFQCLQYR